MQSGYWLILSSLLFIRVVNSDESSPHGAIFKEEIAPSTKQSYFFLFEPEVQTSPSPLYNPPEKDFVTSFLDLKHYNKISSTLATTKENKALLHPSLRASDYAKQTILKLALPTAFQISLPSYHFHTRFLTHEAYPDYSVGSPLWAEDILGSYTCFRQGEYVNILLQGASHLYREDDFTLFSIPHPLDSPFEYLDLPTDHLVIDRPLLETNEKREELTKISFKQSFSPSFEQKDLHPSKNLHIENTRRRFAPHKEILPQMTSARFGEKMSLKKIEEVPLTQYNPSLFQREEKVTTLLQKPSLLSSSTFHFEPKIQTKMAAVPHFKKVEHLPLFEKEAQHRATKVIHSYEKREFVYTSSHPLPNFTLHSSIDSTFFEVKCVEMKNTHLSLQRTWPSFSESIYLPKYPSIPDFQEFTRKKEVSVTDLATKNDLPKQFQLSKEASKPFENTISPPALEDLQSNEPSISIGYHLLETHDLLSTNLLLSTKTELTESVKLTADSKGSIAKALLLFKVDFKETLPAQIDEPLYKKRPSTERLSIPLAPLERDLFSLDLTTWENLTLPPLYPSKEEKCASFVKLSPSKELLYQNKLKNHQFAYPEEREKLLSSYLPIKNETIIEENYFTSLKQPEMAKAYESEFEKVQGKHTTHELVLSHLEKISLVSLDRLLPFTSNYLEGISLLDIRAPSSYQSVFEDAKLRNRTYRCTAYTLSTLPTPETLHTDRMHGEFSITSSIVPQMAEDGYIFSLALSAKETFDRKPIRHHIYFLIDRSSSIERHRFDVFKNAVANSITFLSDDNLFNIFMFDNKAEPLSLSDLRATKASMKIAKDFLGRQSQPWLSSNAILLDLLNAIHDKAVQSDEIYTAIVLTSANGLKNLDQQKTLLKKLLHTPNSNFIVHTAVVGGKNDIPVLDLFSGLYGGSLLYSNTHAAFPRKLAVLTKNIKHPIMTDLRISLVDEDEDIKFYHNPKITSYLCKDRTMNFMGTAKELKEFDVLIQGKIQNRWVNIRQKVNLNDAEKGRSKLEKQLALQRAYNHCAEFLVNGDPEELTAAQTILKPFNITQP